MKEIINGFMKTKEYVCIHKEAVYNDFSYGRIIGHDDNNVAYILISPEGYDDGILIEDIEEIRFIEQGGPYDEKMSKLMGMSNYKDREIEVSPTDLIQWGLEYAHKNRLMVIVEVEKSGRDNIMGLVKSIERGLCAVTQIDLYGEYDGDAYVRIESISHLWIDSVDARRMLALYDINRDCNGAKK